VTPVGAVYDLHQPLHVRIAVMSSESSTVKLFFVRCSNFGESIALSVFQIAPRYPPDDAVKCDEGRLDEGREGSLDGIGLV
jgi:hypothetical protein